MNDLTRIAQNAAITGTIASVATTAALMLLARAEGRGVLQPTNATSHWLHGDTAGWVRRADAEHTAVGYATHHASALFWALPFEAWLATRPPRPPLQLLREASVMAAIAAAVDYGLVPKRLTPGWETVLSRRSVAVTFAALALALAGGAMINQDRRLARRRDRDRRSSPGGQRSR